MALLLIQALIAESAFTEANSPSYLKCNKSCSKERVDCTNECRVDYIRNRRRFMECATECTEDFVECNDECRCLISCDNNKSKCLTGCRSKSNYWSRRRCAYYCNDEFAECYDECMWWLYHSDNRSVTPLSRYTFKINVDCYTQRVENPVYFIIFTVDE